MADKAIHELTEATEVRNEDTFVLEQDGTAKKLSGHTLGDYVYAAAADKIAEVEQAVADAQTAVNDLEAQKDTIAQTIASMAGLGTDTTLSTAGMAADAKAAGMVKNAVARGYNNISVPIEMTSGYIVLNVSKVSSMPPPVVETTTYRHALVSCQAGDRFIINASGKSTAKPWGFLASDGTVLSPAPATSQTENYVAKNQAVVAPTGAVYLVINDNLFDSFSYSGSVDKLSLNFLDGVENIPSGADLNDYKIGGNYRILTPSVAQNIANIPVFGTRYFEGRLTVITLQNDVSVKQIYSTSAGEFITAVRTGYKSNNELIWGQWEYRTNSKRSYQFSNYYSDAISSGDDLDNYKAIGQYYIDTAEIARTVLHKPTFNGSNLAGVLYVETPGSDTNIVKQTYKTVNGQEANRVFNTAWTDWQVEDIAIYNAINDTSSLYVEPQEGEFTFTSGYIHIDTTNRYADVTTPVIVDTYNTWHTVAECHDGDVFTIIGRGVESICRLWAFVDDTGYVINYDTNAESDAVRSLIAPENATKLIVNSISEKCKLSRRGKKSYQKANELFLRDTVIDRIINTKGADYIGYIDVATQPVDISTRKYSKVMKSAVAVCKPGDLFRINAVGGTVARAWAFLNAGRYVIDAAASGSEAYRDYLIEAPIGAKYLVINMANSIVTIGNVSQSLTGKGFTNYRCVQKPNIDVLTKINAKIELIEFTDGCIESYGNIGDIINLERGAALPEYMVYARSAIVDCTEGDRFTINCYRNSNYTNSPPWCFVDEDNKIVAISGAGPAVGLVLTAPSGAKKLILNDFRIGVEITENTVDIDNFSYKGILVNYNRLNENAEILDGGLIQPNGSITGNFSKWYSTTTFMDVRSYPDKEIYANTKVVIAEYSETRYQSLIKRTTTDWPGLFKLNDGTNYIRVSAQKSMPPEDLFVGIPADAQVRAMEDNISTLYERPKSFGAANAIAKMRQFMNIKWTPTAPVPIITGNYKYTIVYPGTEVVGIPYSSLRAVRKYVGNDISIYTFMTAVHNPRSVIYNRIITDGYLGATYYGTVCTIVPMYAEGFGKGINHFDRWFGVGSLLSTGMFEEITKYEIQPGDWLMINTARTSHVRYVYNTIIGRYGRIDSVGICEGAPPTTGHYRPYDFTSNEIDTLLDNGYRIYRYKGINANDYESSQFVAGYPDEVIDENYDYPDIMTNYGDKCCIEAGTDVVINVLDGKSYNTINIYRNSILQRTITIIADFEIKNIEAGTYRIVITDGTNSSETNFIVADVNGSFDPSSGVVTFSSSNATPIGADVYGDNSTDPGNMGVAGTGKYFTPEELAAGQASMSEHITTKKPYVNVTFVTEYGTAVWWSNPVIDDTWEEWSVENADNVTNRTHVQTDIDS